MRLNPELYQHALAVAIGPYPTARLVPHAFMNIREATDAAWVVWRKLRVDENKERLAAFAADCTDVLQELQQ